MAQNGNKAPPLAVVRAVFWSFLGIRRKAELDADVVRLKPAQVIVAGIIGAALLVMTIILVVRLVISQTVG